MRKIFLSCIWMLFVTTNLFAQWQTIFKDSTQFQFNTLYFLNNDTGFVGGFNIANSGNQNGIIFRTTDGGLTWDTTNLGELILCVQFINESFGFCGGDGGADYLSTDMGVTWQKRGNSATMSDHSSIYFVNPSTGYRSNMQHLIQQTIDTGLTWQNIFSSAGGSYFPGTSRMVFPDNQIGYLAQSRFGQSPTGITSISKTSNGGISWVDLAIPSNFFPYSCYFFNNLAGIAVGRYGKVSKTSDGGITWTSPISISNYFLYDVSFVNDSIGYIVGGYNQYDTASFRKGIIFKTNDYGNSWQVIDSSYFDGLTKLHFPSDSVGYVVGMNGIILKISNANTVSTNIQTISENENSLPIYPNPAIDFIFIQKTGHDKLYVYDTLGNVVIEINEHNDSNDSIQLNISSLPDGIYLVKRGSSSSKFIIKK